MNWPVLALSLLLLSLASQAAHGADLESRVKTMEEMLKRQQQTIEMQQKMIEELKDELAATTKRVESPATAAAPMAPAAEPGSSGASVSAIPGSGTLATGLFGGSLMTNPYISFVLDTNFYSSSINERDLPTRGIPGYSNLGFEQKKGFNLTAGELYLFAPVDPYFNLYATIPFTENGSSIEEAYFLTTALPEGLQIKGGKFKSNFSRLNAQHPHAWDFADIPLPYRGFLGGEGLIEKGAQITYLPAFPFYTILGFEVLEGENEVIFNRNATGGPHGFTGFAKQSLDLGDYSTLLYGPYAVGGQTRTATVADNTFFRGNSQIYGFEAVYKWKPSRQRSFMVQGEYMFRNQSGTLVQSTGIPSDLTRRQDAAYVQALYQVDRFRFGARYDRLSIFKNDYSLGGVSQSFPAPWRATAAIEWNLSEFSRLRLQYNYDRSGGDGRTNNELYLQLILGIGAHGVHAF